MSSTLTSSPESVSLFCVDWGTSSLRVWALDISGHVLASARSHRGTLALAQSVRAGDSRARAQAFEAELRRLVGPALDANPAAPVLACGMVGSSLGWSEAGYLEVPTSIAISRDSLTRTAMEGGHAVWIVPGLHTHGTSTHAYPDVIRGEETQLIGVLGQFAGSSAGTHVVVLPGTHTKWVRVNDGTIEAFSTVMTGEFFSLVMDHSILGEPAPQDADFSPRDFDRGLALGASPHAGSLMAKVFSARGLGLAGELVATSIPSYLSGVLIGDEVAHQLPLYSCDSAVVLCGSSSLTQQYARALEIAGATSRTVSEDVTVTGLLAIARSAGLLAQEHEGPTGVPSHSHEHGGGGAPAHGGALEPQTEGTHR